MSSFAKVASVMQIRLATADDHNAIWKIFQAVLVAGDTYPFEPEMPREDALGYWFQKESYTYVADEDGKILGTYILKPNWSGAAKHVANAAFMVSTDARGRGVGRAMGEHCLEEARRLGFRAMQFNFVVSTNEAAVKLWQNIGMKIIATLPGAFRHPSKGYVDVYVMFRSLVD